MELQFHSLTLTRFLAFRSSDLDPDTVYLIAGPPGSGVLVVASRMRVKPVILLDYSFESDGKWITRSDELPESRSYAGWSDNLKEVSLAIRSNADKPQKLHLVWVSSTPAIFRSIFRDVLFSSKVLGSSPLTSLAQAKSGWTDAQIRAHFHRKMLHFIAMIEPDVVTCVVNDRYTRVRNLETPPSGF